MRPALGLPAMLLLLAPILASCSNPAKEWESLPGPTLVPHEIKLLSPGSEPRRTLRYAPGDDKFETIRYRTSIKADWSWTDGPDARDKLDDDVDVELRLEDVSADGTATLQWWVSRYKSRGNTVWDNGHAEPVDDGPAAAFLKKSTGHLRVDHRGRVLEVGMKRDGGWSAQDTVEDLEGTLYELFTPFPQEAVGVGARWSVADGYGDGAYRLTGTTHYTLESMTSSEIRISFTYEGTLDGGRVHGDWLDRNDVMVFEGGDTKGSGTVHWRSGQIVPGHYSYMGEFDDRGNFKGADGSESDFIVTSSLEGTVGPGLASGG